MRRQYFITHLVTRILFTVVTIYAFPSPFIVTSGDLISQTLSTVAKLVLQSRLQELQSVDVQVKASPLSILGGGVDGVRVHGTKWCTPMKLSCRELNVKVGRTAIDVTALITTRRIVLQNSAMGVATMVFSGADWQNFLMHPLMSKALADRRSVAPCPSNIISFTAADEGTQPILRAATVSRDGVEFSVLCYNNDNDDNVPLRRVRLYQPRGGRVMASVMADDAFDGIVKPTFSSSSSSSSTAGAGATIPDVNTDVADNISATAMWIVEFFETLVLDLDGCELRFQSLTSETDRLELQLDVRVRSFPSLDINF
jgi:hypothetical protein